MKKYKIEIENESQFNEVIELAEKIGYRKPSFLYQRINNYLFLKHNGMLHTGTFEPETYKEITIEQLRILAGHGLKKVWAWDDDVNEAFETYLIKEFHGFEYKYLCIAEAEVGSFEEKECIATDTFINISETDPRTPNDVLKIVEKYGKDKLITIIEKL